MRNLPILFLHTFSPIPESAVSNSRGLVSPNVFLNIHSVATTFINDHPHLVNIVGVGHSSFDFRGQVCRRHFALAHGHVAHLRSAKVHAITDCVHSFNANDAHGGI